MLSYSTLIALALICLASLSHGVPAGAGVMEETNKVEVIGGFVMFRRVNGSTEYLLLEKDDEPGDWSPPKGHTEGDEHPIDAAYRETREETGLLPQHYELLLGYHQYFEYETSKGDEKQVSLWTAQLTAINQPIVISEESRDYKWASTHETLQIVKKQYKDAYVKLLATVQCHFDLAAC